MGKKKVPLWYSSSVDVQNKISVSVFGDASCSACVLLAFKEERLLMHFHLLTDSKTHTNTRI